LNGTILQDKIASSGGRLKKLMDAGKTDAEILEELYLATMSRYPTASETQAVTEILAEAGSRQEGWEDLFWSLLNCSEFVFQH
ncbi:MAG: cell surface protein, partial [Planctomycetaceae bacterium]